MNERAQFELYKALLKTLVVRRGGDAAQVDRDYSVPEPAAPPATSATSMSAFLTGGASPAQSTSASESFDFPDGDML